MASNDHTDTPTEPPRYVFHTLDGEVHKGPKKNCPKCKSRIYNKKRWAESKKSGRAGGKKTQKKRSLSQHKTVPCSQCGKEIDSRTRTGMCIVCHRKDRTKNKKKEVYGTCKRCKGPVSHRNKTGFCRDCYRTSKQWEEQHAAHANWVSVNVCEEDAKTRQTQRT